MNRYGSSGVSTDLKIPSKQTRWVGAEPCSPCRPAARWFTQYNGPYSHLPLSVLHFTSPSPVPGTTIMRCWTKWLKTTPSGPERKTIVPTFCKAVVLGLVQENAKMEDYQIPYWTVLRTFWKTSRTSLRGFPSPVCWLGHLARPGKERGLRTHPITLHFWDRAPSS